ncbi:helix-turn-helix domain-containing protein [Flavobacterium sp. RHBU_24]|uniref:helix-turn-helix domain-containing protein n=1 Tax=Flavobacterium sp. RHBU_24 TaxID=3391185 RepID=UPI003985580D
MARGNTPVISYSCEVSRKRDGEQSVQDHSLTIVIKGSYELDNGYGKVIFSSGDIFFCAKNQLLKYRKLNQSEKDFKSLTIFFDEQTLFQFSRENNSKASEKKHHGKDGIKPIEKSSVLATFMRALTEYEETFNEMSPQLMHIKQQEALILLLKYDENLRNILFDFSLPVKADLENFMEGNYRFNVSLNCFAYLTGRSLSAFKRDFFQKFHETPARWLLKRRLESAYNLLTEGKSASDVYQDLGFESLSHFSHTFKKQYGVSPIQIYGSDTTLN